MNHIQDGLKDRLAGAIAAFVVIVAIGSNACKDSDQPLLRMVDPPRSTALPAALPAAPTTEPAPPPPMPTPEPMASPAADVSVSAEQLRRDYEANEVSADDKYRNKMLTVTGIVTAVKKDPFDQPYVVLATSNMFEGVHARFTPEGDSDLRSFLRGDKIVVRCVGNNVTIGSPQLKNCVLQHHYRWRTK